MSKPAPAPDPAPILDPTSIESRMETEKAALITARDQLRLQLNGVENQLYLLNRLMHPAPTPAPTPSPSDTPPGTI